MASVERRAQDAGRQLEDDRGGAIDATGGQRLDHGAELDRGADEPHLGRVTSRRSSGGSSHSSAKSASPRRMTRSLVRGSKRDGASEACSIASSHGRTSVTRRAARLVKNTPRLRCRWPSRGCCSARRTSCLTGAALAILEALQPGRVRWWWRRLERLRATRRLSGRDRGRRRLSLRAGTALWDSRWLRRRRQPRHGRVLLRGGQRLDATLTGPRHATPVVSGRKP